MLAAFDEFRKEAFGYSKEIEYSDSGFARLSKFDFDLLDAGLAKLSILHPEESGKSAVAQRLIQHIVVVKSHFRQLQTLVPVSVTKHQERSEYLSLSPADADLVKASDEKYTACQRFLIGLYAPRLGINPLSLVIDGEIMKFEHAMRQFDTMQRQRELDRAVAAWKEKEETLRAPNFR